MASELSGVSASAGVNLGSDVNVTLNVSPESDGDIACALECDGRRVIITFRAAGDVDTDVL